MGQEIKKSNGQYLVNKWNAKKNNIFGGDTNERPNSTSIASLSLRSKKNWTTFYFLYEYIVYGYNTCTYIISASVPKSCSDAPRLWRNDIPPHPLFHWLRYIRTINYIMANLQSHIYCNVYLFTMLHKENKTERKEGSKKTGRKQFRVGDIEALMNTIIIRWHNVTEFLTISKSAHRLLMFYSITQVTLTFVHCPSFIKLPTQHIV